MYIRFRCLSMFMISRRFLCQIPLDTWTLYTYITCLGNNLVILVWLYTSDDCNMYIFANFIFLIYLFFVYLPRCVFAKMCLFCIDLILLGIDISYTLLEHYSIYIRPYDLNL